MPSVTSAMAEPLVNVALSLAARTVTIQGIDPDDIYIPSTDATDIAMAMEYCNPSTDCPMEWATIGYHPSMAGNSIYLIAFVILFAAQLFYGIRKKTWTYMSALLIGIFAEAIGYIGRLMLSQNPYSMDNFLMNLVPLTIAPALFTAGIYLCLSRVITVVGSQNSRLKPKMYTYVFIGFDLLSLILQALGGGIASTANDKKGSDLGTNIMIGGLICQVISMILFFIIWGDFALRVRRNKASGALTRNQPPLYEGLRATKMFHLFQWSLFVATLLVFIRCIYRVAELWDGFSGHLANDEATFMIFEGPLIIIALTAMTVFHPGRVFGNLWVPAGKGVRSDGSHKLLTNMSSSSSTNLADAVDWARSNNQTAYSRV
ncbi:RTA1-domain-containing protein [Pleomassaria siparia CBS 279.74]|uniref:RTA1-domain-containing protein n=1 Tax=Pleomassaria siparia CBS 279.74 TaxID=1314801 RepID=A0A6G1KQI5_9PLEO|nr:RTA1-domain-containing protein [Pleomassaria siparia CBS 279.74]